MSAGDSILDHLFQILPSGPVFISGAAFGPLLQPDTPNIGCHAPLPRISVKETWSEARLAGTVGFVAGRVEVRWQVLVRGVTFATDQKYLFARLTSLEYL